MPSIFNGTSIWKVKAIENYSDILSNDEQAKALRFLHSKDKDSFICRRTALRILLGRYTGLEPAEIEFIPGKNKKPELKNHANIYFNVSHSEELILIAISDKSIGVDIEHIKPELNSAEVLKYAFNEQEITFINDSKQPADSFFELWTRKEALTKASSKGLDDDLCKIPSLDGEHKLNKEIIALEGDWQLNSFKIDKEYIASIACRANQKLSFFSFEF